MRSPTELASAICASLGASLIRQIGKGAFKHTFLIESQGQQAALKVLNAGCDSQRLQREVDAMVRCAHPNIASLQRVDEIRLGTERHLYLIEEYLDGGSLQERLKGSGTMSVSEVRSLIAELNAALAYLHSANLVHRDIKPDNVMFRKDRASPILVDFGIVRDLTAESLTASFAIQGPGTPLYAAPEQLRNEKNLIDWRTDQFSVGVTASYCLSGTHPYEELGDALTRVVQRVIDRRGPSAEFVARCQSLALPCLPKMVDPWPVRRYRTASEMIDDWRVSG